MGWFTKSSSSSSSSGEWIKLYLCSHVVGNRWLETIAKLCLEQLTPTSDLTWPKIWKKLDSQWCWNLFWLYSFKNPKSTMLCYPGTNPKTGVRSIHPPELAFITIWLWYCDMLSNSCDNVKTRFWVIINSSDQTRHHYFWLQVLWQSLIDSDQLKIICYHYY